MRYNDIDPRDIDPNTNRPYSNYSCPSLDTAEHDYEMAGGGSTDRADEARQMGALALRCGLQRCDNPFDIDSPLGDHWDAGYGRAVAEWRAELRANVADHYGDEAADYV